MKKFLVFLVVVHIISQAQAQYELLLLDGKQISTKELAKYDSLSVYSYLSSKGKTRFIEQDFIYSIRNPQGEVSVIYQPNELSNNYSAEQMFSFIKGEQAASNYKPYVSTFISFGIGAGASIAFPKQGLNVFYSSFVPLVYTGATFLLPVNTKHLNTPVDCAFPDVYKTGFLNKAEKKRFVYGLAGSLLGTSLGLAINAANMK